MCEPIFFPTPDAPLLYQQVLFYPSPPTLLWVKYIRATIVVCLYLFVIKCIWTLSQKQLLNSNPFFGEKNICCLFNFIGLLDGSTTQWRRSPTHHKALHPAGEAIHSWKTKSAGKKKKKIASAFLCFPWINAKSFILKLFPPSFILPPSFPLNEWINCPALQIFLIIYLCSSFQCLITLMKERKKGREKESLAY